MNAMQAVDRPGDRALLVALNNAPGLGRAAICRLGADLDRWRDGVPPEEERDLAAGFSISLDSLRTALAVRAGAKAVLAYEEQALDRLDGQIVTCRETGYPARLTELALPPPVLEVAGSPAAGVLGSSSELPAAAAGPARVAIVGSRKATPYGLEIATWLAREIAGAGVVVVSGFARGIDAAAHLGALSAENGRTVGVLGCGLSFDYPKGHRELGLRMRQRGALISEFPCALPPAAANFPIRNRIIAALADVVVVVEAAARSGSLITARLALELGREVLAVPGRVTDEQALGTNDLLRDGAAPVTHPDDILERIGLGAGGPRHPFAGSVAAAPRSAPPELPAAQAALFSALDPARFQAVDALAAAAGVGIDVAVAGLLELELGGWAVRAGGGGYRRGGP